MKRFGIFLCAGVVALVAVALAEAQGPGGFPPPQGPKGPGLVPLKGLKADLTITKLKATREEARVTVKNQGKRASRATKLLVEILEGKRVLFRRTVRVPALQPGETKRLTVHLGQFEHVGHDRDGRRDRDDRHVGHRPLRLRATIDPGNNVPETNERNNTRVRVIPFGPFGQHGPFGW